MSQFGLHGLAEIILDRAGIGDGAFHDRYSDTHLLRHTAPTGSDATVYRPLLCMVLQGAKQVRSSAKAIDVRAGQTLVVSHTTPVISRITEASQASPYLALVFPIDLGILRSLSPTIRPSKETHSNPFSLGICETDEGLEDAIHRYLLQCHAEETRATLAPITAQEIHARLLIGNHGPALRRLLWQDSTESRIHLATHDIQTNLSDAIVIGDLAQRIGMSNSAFFKKFKAITGTTPLQYQKDLRLLKARDDLRNGDDKVAQVALRVGYESPAQFSREYTRKFGLSPRQDRRLNSHG